MQRDKTDPITGLPIRDLRVYEDITTRKYDIVIPIDYANQDFEPCFPEKGTKFKMEADFSEHNIPLELMAKSVVYEIKNKYYRKPVDEKENEDGSPSRRS